MGRVEKRAKLVDNVGVRRWTWSPLAYFLQHMFEVSTIQV